MVDVKSIKGWDYLKLSLLVFVCIHIENVYIMLGNLLLKEAVSSTLLAIINWVATGLSWGLVVYLTIRYAKKNLGFSLNCNEKIGIIRWGIVLIPVLVKAILWCTFGDGLMVYQTFVKYGVVKFIFQYIYYIFETAMFTSIVVFGQLGCEKWFKNRIIPYGGIICGLTWGLMHTFYQGRVADGIYHMVEGFIFGIVYLILKKDVYKTYLILFLTFTL